MFERAARIAGVGRRDDRRRHVAGGLSAASLVRCLPPAAPIWLVDPGRPDTAGIRNPLTVIRKRAAEGVPELVGELLRGMRG